MKEEAKEGQFSEQNDYWPQKKIGPRRNTSTTKKNWEKQTKKETFSLVKYFEKGGDSEEDSF